VTALQRRLQRLERSMSSSSRWDAIDSVLADLSMSELVALVQHGKNVDCGIHPTPEQAASYGRLRDRLASVGISLP